ncbi:MAG: hypothetical protein KDA78_08410 [Planctomycetaceae bacterium]|nr:hypothetical protein [Planctomycetaceae bacterium]
MSVAEILDDTVSTKTYRLLVIDDNEAIHNDFKKIFKRDDSASELDNLALELFGDDTQTQKDEVIFEMDHALQGEEGFHKVVESLKEDNPYSMAFVDMRMPPGWDGLETISKIWEVDPGLHVVICTAYADYSWQEIFDRLGQSDRLLILKKPFENAEVCQMASAMCEKRRLYISDRHHIEEMEQLVIERTAEVMEAKLESDKKANDLRKALNELKQVQSTLLHAEKLASVGQLAAGIAHEINTPVQFVGDNIRACSDMFDDVMAIMSQYQALLQKLENDSLFPEDTKAIRDLEQNYDLEYISEEVPLATTQSLEGVDRVRTIVKAMKDFSHGGALDEATSFDLNEALQSTLIVARNELKYVANVEADLGDVPCIEGYPSELNQVFLNLFINAAHTIEDKKLNHGGPDMGTIVVSTRVEGEEVMISIRDSGCGITEAVKKKMFDPFFTTKEVGKGTGQGLAITHNIVVKKHQGRIEVDTVLGEGTTFRLYLPLSVNRGCQSEPNHDEE